MESSGILHHVALVRTDVSEVLSASIMRVTKISELGTTLAVTSNLCMLCSSPFLVTLMMEAPHGVTSQKTPFFIVTAMKTSNFTMLFHCMDPISSPQGGI
jgi:hypothetical protein